MYYTVLLATIFLVMNVTKLDYHQARPFWVSPDIEAGSCSTQFGNPSGHSLTAMGMALSVWLDYNSAIDHDSLKYPWKMSWMRILLLVLAIIFAMSIGWSRFVLGAHSMNQIIFGLLLGAWLALTYHFLLNEPFLNQMKELADGDYFKKGK